VSRNLQETRLVFASGIALMIGCFLYFWYIVPYHVCFKEQIQLFTYNSSYILSYFSKPAAFACLAGDFLTQFFYFKIAGAAIITLLLVLEWWLILLILKRFSAVETLRATSPQRATPLQCTIALLPVIVEWISFANPSFSVALSVSFIIALSAFIVYAKTGGKTAVIMGILLIPTLYIIAGASVFLFVILITLYNIHRNKKFLIFHSSFFIFLAVITPLIFRHIYLLTLKQAYFYPFQDIKQMLSLVVLAFVVLIFVCFKKLRGQNSGILYFAISLVVLVSILITGLIKNTDRKQESIFGITIEAYHNNWDKVLKIAEKAELKSPVATCYTNIALSKKSLLGERLMDFYQPFTSGLLLPIAPGSGWLTIFSGSDAYYHIGDMGMAQHAAMLGMIFSPKQRSARMMERLLETNLISGDTAAAVKYARILESTLFHKIKPDRLRDNLQQGTFRKDMIRNSTNTQASLELLAESNPDNLPAVDYLLCYYLLNKNIPAFFKAYTTYCKGKNTHVPKVYAEALMIYFAVTKGTINEVSQYGIPSEAVKSFGEYTRLYEKSNGNLAPVQKNFPNTYWLFYHFATMN